MNWLKKSTGWDDLTPEMQQEKKHLIFAYTAGFITALILVALI